MVTGRGPMVILLGLAVGLVGCGGHSGRASLAVPTLIGDGMVLQRGMPDAIWGDAVAGARVRVTIGRTALPPVRASRNGRWRVDLPAMPASTSPMTLTVVSGDERIRIDDVQVGEVWGCSGQSNMEYPLRSSTSGAAAARQASKYDLRLFREARGVTPDRARWQIADPATAGAFSAVCYHFGRELAQRLRVPVGLIQATWPGTRIEEWTRAAGGRSDGKLFDTKIRPLVPYGVRGFTWYQGESNGDDPAYLDKLRGLIREWRSAWGEGDFPFGIVQLPVDRSPTVREAQLRCFLRVPRTFLAVTADLPTAGGLHPSTKEPVGVRLAIGARAVAYGEPIESVGPVADAASSSVSGRAVFVGFSHLGGGLVTGSHWQRAGSPTPFEVAGADGSFHPATATIVGNRIALESPSVAHPTQVRYSWDRHLGGGNLYSLVRIRVDGGAAVVTRLPAAPFELALGPAAHAAGARASGAGRTRGNTPTVSRVA